MSDRSYEYNAIHHRNPQGHPGKNRQAVRGYGARDDPGKELTYGKKLRKMLGDVNAPSTVALMRLLDTQSKTTICN